ncbi:hypothetical protein [Citricoccus sp. I39-566]|uniref:hypothetical protein n=1 Tax=Citricoccus sp. I39-566 TaxID=3073268 RepID=UPI00286B6396|nr:hypothetical protein [Citricoccus sp. I39-566]WMY77520.1 hypothetical protein RE421_11795 [Citricoccus sp. I39-566]
MVGKFRSVELKPFAQSMLQEGPSHPSTLDSLAVGLDVEAMAGKLFVGAVDGQMKSAIVRSLKVEVEVSLLRRDLPDVSPRVVVVSTQDDKNLPLRHHFILWMKLSTPHGSLPLRRVRVGIPRWDGAGELIPGSSLDR